MRVDATANNGEYVGPEICEMNCFAATASFTTVPYFSLDQPRSVTIVYNGDQAFPRPYIYADVNANDGTGVGVSYFELSATLNGSPVTFITGGTTVRQSGSLLPTRIVAEMDGAALSTNVYPLVVTVKATYNDNGTAQTSSSASLLIVNESNSAIAKGWTVAGVQHLYSAIGGKYIITSGDGSAIVFSGLGVLALDYSKVTFDATSSTYTRTYKDGSRVIFNSVGQETSFIELNGRTYTFFYDAQGRLSSVRDPYRTQPDGTPASIGLAYDANGLHQIQEPGPDRWNWHGRNTWFVVDANRRLTSVQDPDGISTGYGYDASGRLSTITDRRGSITTLGYDVNSWKLVSVTLPQIPVDAGGGATTLTSPIIRLTPYQGGSLGAIVDAANRVTTFTVNKYGQALDITAPYGQHTTIVRSGILPVRITHPDSATDTLAYDSQGRMTKSHLAGQDSVKFSYTGLLLTTVTGPGTSSSVTYHYNANNKVDTVTSNGTPLQRTVYTYDNVTGQPATVSDQLHHQVTYLFDPNFGNVRSETVPGNRTATKILDGFGRDSIVARPTGAPEVVLYDLLNRVTSDSAFTRKITLAYDQLFQTDLYDANGNHYHTDFNALGWPTRQCDALSLCGTTRYDASGAVTSTTNRRNQIVSVTRDSLGRITSRTGPGLISNSYSYGANGHDMVAWNSLETDSIYTNPGDQTHAATDSVVTLIDSKRYRVFHKYPRLLSDIDSVDISSNTGTLFDPRVTAYQPSGFLSYFKVGTSLVFLGPDSDGVGGLTRYPSVDRTSTGLSTHVIDSVGFNLGLLPNFQRNYHYDLDNRIDQMLFGNAANQFVLGYDALGQLLSVEHRTGCSFVGRDSTSGRNYSCSLLLSTQNFTYDAMGNRTDNGGTPTTGNRYSSFYGASYTYDADGNVSRKYKPSVYDIYYYWNALNQLDSVVYNGSRTQFEYNAFDQPVRVKEGSGYPLPVARYLLWNGGNLLAQLNPAGQRWVDYSYLPGGTDHPVAYQHGANSPTDISFFEIDESGNVIGSSQSGSSREENSYDVWGGYATNNSGDQAFYWKGLFWNGGYTGLYYMRNRWYDPESGRFVNEDPAGFAGGFNLYAYSGNDPVNGTDPSGLDADEPGCEMAQWETYAGSGVMDPASTVYDLGGCAVTSEPAPELPPDPYAGQGGSAPEGGNGAPHGLGGGSSSGAAPTVHPTGWNRWGSCILRGGAALISSGIDIYTMGELREGLALGRLSTGLLARAKQRLARNGMYFGTNVMDDLAGGSAARMLSSAKYGGAFSEIFKSMRNEAQITGSPASLIPFSGSVNLLIEAGTTCVDAIRGG